MIKDDYPVPTAEVELLAFALDGSGSMADTNTSDGRSKADHLFEIVQEVLQILSTSSKKDAFRVSVTYFSDKITSKENMGTKYFSIENSLNQNHLQNPLDVTGGGATRLADTILEVRSILDEFDDDQGLPSQKRATVFLFTDGLETERGDDGVREEAQQLSAHILAPIIATISFGSDANEELLKEIASTPSERQKDHMDKAGLLIELPDHNKLFIQGHSGNTITERKAKTIRNFVETLSKTRDPKE